MRLVSLLSLSLLFPACGDDGGSASCDDPVTGTVVASSGVDPTSLQVSVVGGVDAVHPDDDERGGPYRSG